MVIGERRECLLLDKYLKNNNKNEKSHSFVHQFSISYRNSGTRSRIDDINIFFFFFNKTVPTRLNENIAAGTITTITAHPVNWSFIDITRSLTVLIVNVWAFVCVCAYVEYSSNVDALQWGGGGGGEIDCYLWNHVDGFYAHSWHKVFVTCVRMYVVVYDSTICFLLS